MSRIQPSWLCSAPGPSGLESPERGPLTILTPVTPCCPGAPAIFILWLGWFQEFSQQSCWHLGRQGCTVEPQASELCGRWSGTDACGHHRARGAGLGGYLRGEPIECMGLMGLDTYRKAPKESQTQLPTGTVWRRLAGWAQVESRAPPSHLLNGGRFRAKESHKGNWRVGDKM